MTSRQLFLPSVHKALALTRIPLAPSLRTRISHSLTQTSPTNRHLTQSSFRAMSSGSSSNLPNGKSEEEWRAILNPQQVCVSRHKLLSMNASTKTWHDSDLVQDSSRERDRSSFQRRIRQTLSIGRRLRLRWLRNPVVYGYY